MNRALSFCNYRIRDEIGMKLQKLCMLHAESLHLDVFSTVNIMVSDVCVGSVQNLYLTGSFLPLTTTPPLALVLSNYHKSVEVG